MPLARISLTLSRYFSLSFIACGRSSGLHPVSSHSCCMYVRAGRLAFARPYVGVHRSTSLMSSFLLLQQCSACLVRLAWIVFVMGGRWPYSWCLVGCCLQDFSILPATFLWNCRLRKECRRKWSCGQWRMSKWKKVEGNEIQAYKKISNETNYLLFIDKEILGKVQISKMYSMITCTN